LDSHNNNNKRVDLRNTEEEKLNQIHEIYGTNVHLVTNNNNNHFLLFHKCYRPLNDTNNINNNGLD